MGHSSVKSDGGASEGRVLNMSSSSYRMAKSRDIDLNKEKSLDGCAVSCIRKAAKLRKRAAHEKAFERFVS